MKAALGQTVGSKVDAAYQRGDLFEKRKRLMAAWAEFCAKGPAGETSRRSRAHGDRTISARTG